MSKKNVSIDTSVLVNFLRIDRMDLIANHPYQFVVTDSVAQEIIDAFAVLHLRFTIALDKGVLIPKSDNKAHDLKTISKLLESNRLGVGECSAIAIAINYHYCLATDDKQAIKKACEEAKSSGVNLEIVRTENIMVKLINTGYLTMEQADEILHDWARNHKFWLRISSFSQIIDLSRLASTLNSSLGNPTCDEILDHQNLPTSHSSTPRT